eukprot:m.106112 g.106112  ORF g.106112 m.106112 type:complete len:993 (+) comp14216_c1_seq7:94-3072(+)
MSNPRISRTNSMIRGSGHSLAGNRANRNSIMQGSHGRGAAAVFDLVLLEEITEDSVCHNINAMFMNDMIYSYIGNVVISVNPFRELPIYDKATIDKYRGRSAFDPKLSPHIFALADNVFNDMRYRGRDQVVIISGESGAGKTEASKKIMQYVAAVSGSTEKVNEVKNKLLNTNPVLEAFGNAKTVRNDNSSRFGKYMDIQFDFHGEPAGGFITTYLLEKARVIRQNEGERNFHIFYQLLAGGEAAKLKIPTDAKSYKYLSGGGPGSEHVKGMNDAEWFREMVKGLAAVGFSDADRKAMFEVLGAILLLGQVTFKGKASGCDANTLPPQLATLLGVPEAAIGPALTHNTVVVNRQSVASHLNEAQAVAARDTLAKAMYDRLFTWVYTRINELIAAPKAQIKAVIGVLDIYGFEILTVNSFEQFCINYCNEKLQQLFIELTLKQEQDEYLSEGITWHPVEYFNNKIICDLVEARPTGIVALLDEESIRPGDKTDAAWLDKMRTSFASHKHFVTRAGPQDRSLPEGTFKLVHYAGDVVYTVNGFLEKNTDTLFKDLSRLMFSSKNAILHDQFPEGDERTWQGAAKRPPTAGKAFVTSMQAMIDTLNTKIPSYVRCIKPNHRKTPKKIEDDLLRHQVKYLGLVENVRVRRAGFCFRETIEDFFWRYKLLSPATYPRWSGAVRDGVIQIMNDMGLNRSTYQLGKTKVFIKNPTSVFRLEEERDVKIEQIVQRLQVAWRLYRIRKDIRAYYNELLAKFKDVAKDPRLGARVVWPKHAKSLDDAERCLKRIYKNWWARKKVLALSEEQRALMRLQLIAHTLLANKKKGFSLKKGFPLLPLQHPKLAEFTAAHGPAVYAVECFKMSRKGVAMKRFVVMTAEHIYKTDASFAVKGRRVMPIKEISSVSVSPHCDCMVVLRSIHPGQDSVLLVGVSSDCVPQFLALLYVTARALGHKIEIGVEDAMKYNNSNKPTGEKAMQFRENPTGVAGTYWRKGQVLYA